MKIILIILYVCGAPDTFIVQYPGEQAKSTHRIKSPVVVEEIVDILKTDPVVIEYQDERGICV